MQAASAQNLCHRGESDQAAAMLQVAIRIHKIVDADLFRWPVQLELADEEIAPLIMAPDEYQMPANVAKMQEQGMSPEEVRPC